MAAPVRNLWGLVKYRPQIDPNDLAAAVAEEAGQEPLDYRTRLLIRDSLEALKQHWGSDRLTAWLADSPARPKVEAIWREDFERPGFPSLARRLVEKTDPEEVRRFLRELGLLVRR